MFFVVLKLIYDCLQNTSDNAVLELHSVVFNNFYTYMKMKKQTEYRITCIPGAT